MSVVMNGWPILIKIMAKLPAKHTNQDKRDNRDGMAGKKRATRKKDK